MAEERGSAWESTVTSNRSPLLSLVVWVGHCEGLSQIALDSWGELYLVVREEEHPKIELAPKLCCLSSYLGAAGKMGWGNLSQNKQVCRAKAGGRSRDGSRSHPNDAMPSTDIAFSPHFSSSGIYNTWKINFFFVLFLCCLFVSSILDLSLHSVTVNAGTPGWNSYLHVGNVNTHYGVWL